MLEHLRQLSLVFNICVLGLLAERGLKHIKACLLFLAIFPNMVSHVSAVLRSGFVPLTLLILDKGQRKEDKCRGTFPAPCQAMGTPATGCGVGTVSPCITAVCDGFLG